MSCRLRELKSYVLPACVFICLCLCISLCLRDVKHTNPAFDFNSLWPSNPTETYITIDFIHCPPCKGNLSIIITSATDNAQKRQAIRQTWARDRPVRFLLGEPKNPAEQKQIDEEALKYEDIVQGTFIDTYRNLTHKSILGLMYVKTVCRSRYTLKTDDDVYVQIDKLEKYLQNKSEDILCRKKHNSAVVRKSKGPGSKWKVSLSEYSKETYPDYCLGNYGAILSSKSIDALLSQIPSTHFLWIEDAFITGVLRENADVSLTEIDGSHFVFALSAFKTMKNRTNIFWGPSSLKADELNLVWNITQTDC